MSNSRLVQESIRSAWISELLNRDREEADSATGR